MSKPDNRAATIKAALIDNLPHMKPSEAADAIAEIFGWMVAAQHWTGNQAMGAVVKVSASVVNAAYDSAQIAREGRG